MSDNESNPNHIPTSAKQLTGKDIYRKWRFEAEFTLQYYRTLDIVNGTATAPTHSGSLPSDGNDPGYQSSLKAYKQANRKQEDITNWAVSFILNNIDEDVKDVIPQDGNPAMLWKGLEEQFDLQTVSTLFITFATLTSLQYSPQRPLNDHLVTYANIWQTVFHGLIVATWDLLIFH
ncbi:hypothetical protein Q9L58_010329 [Maublancomyces gigas]|uniref:Uncharacterized protein n=1 Tax=Discina gigas TaxID=1032678 RepID=A0ABR3G4D9_9PEZI